jgi:hypothetical protein
MRRALREYLYFLRTEPEWWLLPFAVVIVGLFALAYFGDSVSFIYPIF